jgi:hypothetical protein
MAVKVLLVVFSLSLALFGIQRQISNQEQNERARRGRIPLAIEEAKAKNQREVILPAPIPYYARTTSLDDALVHYTTVIAKPRSQYSQFTPLSKEIQTWYKFEVLDFLSQPRNSRCADCSFAKDIPPQLLPVRSDEIVVVRNTGTVVSDGVTVTTSDATFPDFKMNQPYLLFLSLDLETRVGLIEIGPAGVSTIESSGETTAVSDKSNKLNNELKTRYGKIDQIKRRLQFRRFPE